jgi:hypothetical protein
VLERTVAFVHFIAGSHLKKVNELTCSSMIVGRSSGTLRTEIQILVLALFSKISHGLLALRVKSLLEYPNYSYAIFRVRHDLFRLYDFVDTRSKSVLEMSSQTPC